VVGNKGADEIAVGSLGRQVPVGVTANHDADVAQSDDRRDDLRQSTEIIAG
jgi:hypothetical protein